MSKRVCDGEPFRLRPGEFVLIGRRLYVVCADCKAVVWVNRPVIGDLHICDGSRAAA